MSEVKVLISASNKSEAEFKKLQSDLKKVQTEGKKATTVWDRFGHAGKGAASDVSKAMEGASGKAGIFGSVLSKLGPTGLTVGAAIGGIGTALVSGTTAMAEWERRLGRTEALLKSTGYAAGLTARELDTLARDRDLATLGDRNEIMDAINLMQTFKSVSGDTFRESITLAQDMSAVTGQSLTSAATMLGKALENPILGLTAMRRVGVSFTETEEAVVRAMMDTNDAIGAQAKIMDVLRGQFEGAAEGEAQGLLGTLDTLSYEWRDLLEAMGNTDAASEGVMELVRVVRALEFSVKSMSGKFSLDEQVTNLESEVSNTKRLVETLKEEGQGDWSILGGSVRTELNEANERLAELESRLRQVKALREGQDTRDMFLIKDQGKAAADSRANDYEILEQSEARKKADEQLKEAAKVAESEAKAREKRLADYRDELDEARFGKEYVRVQKIEAKYQQMLADGISQGEADTWKAKEISGPDDKKAESEAKAREKRLADYRQKLDEARLGEIAVKRREIEAEYQQMLADGVGRGEADFWREKEFDKLDEKVKDGISQWKDAYGELGGTAKGIWDDMGNDIKGAINTGNKAVDSLLGKLLELGQVQLEGLFTGGGSSSGGFNIFSGIGGFFSSIFHEGGVVGQAAPTRLVPADLFRDAPRFHSGGLVGNEMAIIAKRGEEVLTEDDPRHINNIIGMIAAGSMGGTQVNLTVNNNTPAKVGVTRQANNSGGVDLLVAIDELQAENISRSGTATSAALAARGAAQRPTRRA
ncbi:MAG: phage tail length tape measure family protein [Pseudodesulfovibrio sp.]|uniref:phage tail length tape measure family protein n=1 Tax=Pseudodesulfovibrio sp. TaxID=2035812 RepID=UPI003D0A7765